MAFLLKRSSSNVFLYVELCHNKSPFQRGRFQPSSNSGECVTLSQTDKIAQFAGQSNLFAR